MFAVRSAIVLFFSFNSLVRPSLMISYLPNLTFHSSASFIWASFSVSSLILSSSRTANSAFAVSNSARILFLSRVEVYSDSITPANIAIVSWWAFSLIRFYSRALISCYSRGNLTKAVSGFVIFLLKGLAGWSSMSQLLSRSRVYSDCSSYVSPFFCFLSATSTFVSLAV